MRDKGFKPLALSNNEKITEGLDGELDLVYVDGDHRYEAVLADLKVWLPKLRAGGVMAGHDWSFQAVKKALSEVFPDKETFIFQGDSWALIP